MSEMGVQGWFLPAQKKLGKYLGILLNGFLGPKKISA
jgi:hypothetical protein